MASENNLILGLVWAIAELSLVENTIVNDDNNDNDKIVLIK